MVKEFIANHRDEIVASLQGLLRIESVKGHAVPGAPFGRSTVEALEYVLSLAEKYGLATKNVDGYAGHVEYGHGDDYIAVVSHLDVVPAGSGWSHPPFGGEVHQGKVFGRGVIDDKGPAMSTLWALIALKSLGIEPKRKVRLIFGLDEESDWECMDHYFRHEPKPLGGFTPDARFPLIFAEKGLSTLRIDIPSETDSMSPKVLSFEGGDRFNVVPNEARVDVDCHSSTAASEFAARIRKAAKESHIKAEVWIEQSVVSVVVYGVAAHASRPGDGVNAIVKLAQLLGTGPISNASMWRTVGSWDHTGRGLGIDSEDEETGPLTANLGKAELRDGMFYFFTNIRSPIRLGHEELLQSAQTYLSDKWRVSLVEHLPSMYMDPNSQLIQTLMEVYDTYFDDKQKPLSTGGATYARAIPNAVAFGALFPGREDLAHQIDENWAIEDYLACIEIYADAITRLSNTL